LPKLFLGMEAVDTAPFVTGEWISTEVEYNQRDLLLYAVGIGCEELHFVYEQAPGFGAFPTYPVVLGMKGSSVDTNTPASSDRYLGKSSLPLFGNGPTIPSLPGSRLFLDAERYIEQIREIPSTGMKMLLRSRLMGIHRKGSGALIATESELTGLDGTLYYRFINASFQVGAQGFRESGRSNSQKVELPSREPDAVIEQLVPKMQAHVYRLSGDYNPLHIDGTSSMVADGGLDEPILHGLCTMGHAARAVLGAFAGSDPRRFRALQARFASPVKGGCTLVTRCWTPGGTGRIIFTTEVKETGRVVISNAFMDLRFEASAAKL